MAKVIMFSREFPKYHPISGQPTRFVEKFWNSFSFEISPENELIYSRDLFDLWELNPKLKHGFELSDFIKTLKNQVGFSDKKHHTIRSGNRFKKGDFFSPRVWSGKPYRSKQIIINPDTEIIETWDFEILKSGDILINNQPIFNKISIYEIAKNDGLTLLNFENWFIPDYKNSVGFKGQIICWSDSVDYKL
jgi:hypothetical protein